MSEIEHKSKKSKKDTKEVNENKEKKEKKETPSTRSPIKTENPNISCTLCIPSTCISKSNAKNLEQITHIAYQIAKAACNFNAPEILIMQVPQEEETPSSLNSEEISYSSIETSSSGSGSKRKFDEVDLGINSTKKTNSKKPVAPSKYTNESLLLASLLQYFVTPPYLVKSTFKQDMLKNFEYAKKLPKISTLPFMQNNDTFKDFREGLTVAKKQQKREKTSSGKVKKAKNFNTTNLVNIGQSELFILEGTEIPPRLRVTVNLKTKKIVSPVEAYGIIGAKSAFGYNVRVSSSFSSMFTECSFASGFDKSLWVNCGDYFSKESKSQPTNEVATITPEANKKAATQLLLVLGKWKDIEEAFEDDKSSLEGVESAGLMFDGKLKIPQGIRVEDAAMIALSKLE
ncbi:hypothetical protein B5S28_g1670 [[Candida] boidinii]|uniref:Unnamed protein product n=1 Tax=Candida boidinii TaxID=5477 RepID=A0ACB5TY00_CANBO|nr:hypothetical protein B5S28_g1670 [[Candida] boidinii]OWB61986.1 hypothetical protein B5S29_g2896 [[Candida] boidinii]OWB72979.1 hypothetical protein B5S31_g2708 [[Candida] boidinii]GME96988.1 unnamed protein product [[Candida] boidinii]